MGQNQSLCPTVCSDSKKAKKGVSTISGDSISVDRGSLLTLESDDNIDSLKYSINPNSPASAASDIKRKSRGTTIDNESKNEDRVEHIEGGSGTLSPNSANSGDKSLWRSKKSLSIFEPDIQEDKEIDEEEDCTVGDNHNKCGCCLNCRNEFVLKSRKGLPYATEEPTFEDDIRSKKSLSKNRNTLSEFEVTPDIENLAAENGFTTNKNRKSILSKRKSRKSSTALREQDNFDEELSPEERQRSFSRNNKSSFDTRPTLDKSCSCYPKTGFGTSFEMPNKQLSGVTRQSLQDYDRNMPRIKSYSQKEHCNCRDWTPKNVNNFKDDFEETEMSGSDINLQEYSLPERRKTSTCSKSCHKYSVMMPNTNDVCEVPSGESCNTVNYRNSNIGDCDQKLKIEPSCKCKHWYNKHFHDNCRDRNPRLNASNQRLSCQNAERSDSVRKINVKCPRSSQIGDKRYSQINSERNRDLSCPCSCKHVEICENRLRSICKNNQQRYSKRNTELFSRPKHERLSSEFHSDAEDNYRNSCQRSSQQEYPQMENRKSFNKNYELRRIHSMNQPHSCKDGSQMYQKGIRRDTASFIHSKHSTNDAYDSTGLSKCQYETDTSSNEEIVADDKIKNCCKRTAPSNYELPYQETEQYEYLVDELETTLAERNKERFRKTLQEFEELSKNCEDDKTKRIWNSQDPTVPHVLPEIKAAACNLCSKGDAEHLLENNSSDSDQEFNTQRNTRENCRMSMNESRSKPNRTCCKYCSRSLCAERLHGLKNISSEIPPEGDGVYEKSRTTDMDENLQRKETHRNSFDGRRSSASPYGQSGFVERRKTKSMNNNSRSFYKKPSRVSSSKWEIGPDMEWRKVDEVSKTMPNDRHYWSRSDPRRFSSNDNECPTKRYPHEYTNPLQDYVSHENVSRLVQTESGYNVPSRPRLASKERRSTYRASAPHNDQTDDTLFYDGNFRSSKNYSKVQSSNNERSHCNNNTCTSKALFNSNENLYDNHRGTENISRQELDRRSKSRLKAHSHRPMSNDWFLNMDIPREENRKESHQRRYTKFSDGDY